MDDAMDVSEDVEPAGDDEDEGILDRLRDMPVGVSDPNIIGDAGPTDVPPGSDPPPLVQDDGEI